MFTVVTMRGVNDSTIPHWYASQSTYLTDTGGQSTYSRMTSYGSWGDTDRALGNHFNSGVPLKTSFGIRIYNDTVVSITEFTVQYTGEQWRARNYTPPQAEKLQFAFAVGNATMGVQNGVYYPVTNLIFTDPTIPMLVPLTEIYLQIEPRLTTQSVESRFSQVNISSFDGKIMLNELEPATMVWPSMMFSYFFKPGSVMRNSSVLQVVKHLQVGLKQFLNQVR